MSRVAIRTIVAVTTFACGIAAARVWIVPHGTPPSSITSASQASQIRIQCSGNKAAIRNTIESTINKESKPWDTRETQVSGKENLSVVQFLNANDGWIGGAEHALYKTADGGTTWQKVPLIVPAKAYVASISFVTPSVGWVVAVDGGDIWNDINTVKSWILNTTDGGKSWQPQYSDKALEIYRTHFISELEGWAIGSKIPRSVGYEGFILHTIDGGKNWANVSPRVAKDEQGNTSSVVNLLATEPSKALILKFSRVFYRTEDGGRSWRRVAALPEEPPQALLDEITIVGENRMWAVGGADSIEGMWGTIARMDSDCSWTRYSIGGVYFSNAVFLSGNRVMVSGSIPTPGHEMPRSERDGMVLYSEDGGAHFAMVFRNSKVEIVNALSLADANDVWAVGGKGYVLHLRPPSKP